MTITQSTRRCCSYLIKESIRTRSAGPRSTSLATRKAGWRLFCMLASGFKKSWKCLLLLGKNKSTRVYIFHTWTHFLWTFESESWKNLLSWNTFTETGVYSGYLQYATIQILFIQTNSILVKTRVCIHVSSFVRPNLGQVMSPVWIVEYCF